MEKFKFILFSIIILVVVILLGYWAFGSIESGSTHADKQQIQELQDKNAELEQQVQDLKDQVAELEPAPVENTPVQEEPVKTETDTTTKTVSSKYQSLIKDLQKLIDDKIYMKEKSQGTRVGTVQTFLNIYFNTSKKVDNDYGSGTKADVLKFQKAEGITADGQAGPGTFQKMIDWLEKQ